MINRYLGLSCPLAYRILVLAVQILLPHIILDGFEILESTISSLQELDYIISAAKFENIARLSAVKLIGWSV